MRITKPLMPGLLTLCALLLIPALTGADLGDAGLLGYRTSIATGMGVGAGLILLTGLILIYARLQRILQRKILEHETAEAALIASEAKQRAVIDTMVDAVVTISDEGTVQSFNPAAETIFGYTAGEVVGHNIKMLMPEPHRSGHDGYLAHHLTTGERHVLGYRRELEAQRRDGSIFPIELAVTNIRIHGQRLFSGIVRDISERKISEKQLSQFKSTLDRIHDCVFMFRADTLKFFYVNQGAMDQVGYSHDELMEMYPYEIRPEFSEQQFKDMIAPMLCGEQEMVNLETIHQRKDRTQIPVEIFLQYIAPANEEARFVAIVRDITERKKVDRLKGEFVSTISHELRTPLTTIRGSLGLVTGGVAGELPEQAHALLQLAHNNSERLLLLINDLLDMDKIASGKMDFHFGTLAVRLFIEEALTANTAYAEQYGVRYAITTQLESAHIRGDRDRLMQVMANLLSNASKFSPRGGTVEIGVSRHDDQIRISISDHGPGIPEKFHSKLYEKFTQADASDTRQVGGTGLGLNISRAIVEKHGGRIGFITQIGTGTTFYFELPEIDTAEAGPPAHDDFIIGAQ